MNEQDLVWITFWIAVANVVAAIGTIAAAWAARQAADVALKQFRLGRRPAVRITSWKPHIQWATSVMTVVCDVRDAAGTPTTLHGVTVRTRVRGGPSDDAGDVTYHERKDVLLYGDHFFETIVFRRQLKSRDLPDTVVVDVDLAAMFSVEGVVDRETWLYEGIITGRKKSDTHGCEVAVFPPRRLTGRATSSAPDRLCKALCRAWSGGLNKGFRGV